MMKTAKKVLFFILLLTIVGIAGGALAAQAKKRCDRVYV